MLFQKLIYGNIYCAVEHTFVDGKPRFNVLKLHYKKKSFEIKISHSYESFSEVVSSLSKHQHIFVIINTNKVLSKKIDGVHQLNKSVSIAFPNIKSTDFSIEILPQQSHSFVSICRNQDVESILDSYTEHKINVIGFSLGSNAVTAIIPYSTQDCIQTSNAKIHIKNLSISSIDKDEIVKVEIYEINSLKISSINILPLSGILSYYTNVTSTENNFSVLIAQLKDNYKQKLIFKNTIKIGLGFVFLMLITNFLVFSNYRDKIALLKNEQQVNESYKQTLTALNKDVTRKRNLVVAITASATSKVSFYMDQIGGTIPNSILLSQIEYQPLKKGVKELKEIEVKQSTLIISGKTSNSEDFSMWIAGIENQDWVTEVSVLEYGIGNKSEIRFEIHLTIKS